MTDLKLLIYFMVVYLTFIGGGAEGRSVGNGTETSHPAENWKEKAVEYYISDTFDAKVVITALCVVIGIILVVVVAVLALVYFYRQRKKSKNTLDSTQNKNLLSEEKNFTDSIEMSCVTE